MKNLLILFISFILVSCGAEPSQQKSDSGVKKASVHVNTDPNGQTVEQKNIIERLKRDNELGSIKHLYVISSYTGDVLEYSTVRGKVTSGNKRLSPKTVDPANGQNTAGAVNYVNIGGKDYASEEVLDDGGAYGESANYIYWFDASNNYHQYFPSGGTFLHISDKPLVIRKSSFTFGTSK